MVSFAIVESDRLDPNTREAVPYPQRKKIISREVFHATNAGSEYQRGGQTTWVL